MSKIEAMSDKPVRLTAPPEGYADWLRNRNTVEFSGIWEQVHSPDFNYGGFATAGNGGF